MGVSDGGEMYLLGSYAGYPAYGSGTDLTGAGAGAETMGGAVAERMVAKLMGVSAAELVVLSGVRVCTSTLARY